MIKNFKYGTLVNDAIHYYNNGNYNEAEKILSRAIMLKPNDFISSFWMGRTLAVIGDKEQSNQYFRVCLQLRPDLKDLIEPWMLHIGEGKTEVISNNVVTELNIQTDDLWELYTSKYNLSIKDLFIFCLPFIYISTFALSNLLAKYHLAELGSIVIVDVMQLFVLIAYLRHKVILPLHPFTQFWKIRHVIKNI